MAVLLLAAVALLPLELVKVKMMPFDNKNEFQVMIDMPEGTALETTARVTSALASAALEDETVVNVQQYVGVSAPYNFNGLVRHYFLRRAPHLADLQVNLVARASARRRATKWPDVCASGWLRLRSDSARRSRWRNCRPVRQSCKPSSRRSTGRIRRGAKRWPRGSSPSSKQTPGVVDTDWSVEAPHARIALAVDGEKAAAAGLSPAAVAAVVRMAGSGESAGLLHDERAREDVPIIIRLPRAGRTLEAVQSIRLRGASPVAVGELTCAAATRKRRACITRICSR